jgi:hypothetical protein
MSPLLADTTEYMTLFDIAKKFHMSPETIRLWVVRGILVEGERRILPARKIGGSWRVAIGDLMEWVRTNMDRPVPDIHPMP